MAVVFNACSSFSQVRITPTLEAAVHSHTLPGGQTFSDGGGLHAVGGGGGNGDGGVGDSGAVQRAQQSTHTS